MRWVIVTRYRTGPLTSVIRTPDNFLGYIYSYLRFADPGLETHVSLGARDI